MQRELGHLVNLIAAFEETASAFMAHVMKSQIYNSKDMARASKRSTDALGVVRKNVFVCFGLTLNNLPRFCGVFESPVVTIFTGRVLRIAYQASPRLIVIVSPFEATDLSLAPCRCDGEV